MNDHAPPTPPCGGIIAGLIRRYPDWQIEHETLDAWSAVYRSPDGRHIRMLVAHTAAELSAKLEAAEQIGP